MALCDFWSGDLETLDIYLRAEQNKKQEEIENLDFLAWRIGDYMRVALAGTPLVVPGSMTQDAKYVKEVTRKVIYPEYPLMSSRQQSGARSGRTKPLPNIKPISIEDAHAHNAKIKEKLERQVNKNGRF